jgi:hypothetical protein
LRKPSIEDDSLYFSNYQVLISILFYSFIHLLFHLDTSSDSTNITTTFGRNFPPNYYTNILIFSIYFSDNNIIPLLIMNRTQTLYFFLPLSFRISIHRNRNPSFAYFRLLVQNHKGIKVEHPKLVQLKVRHRNLQLVAPRYSIK